jgi:hypothetical protein
MRKSNLLTNVFCFFISLYVRTIYLDGIQIDIDRKENIIKLMGDWNEEINFFFLINRKSNLLTNLFCFHFIIIILCH